MLEACQFCLRFVSIGLTNSQRETHSLRKVSPYPAQTAGKRLGQGSKVQTICKDPIGSTNPQR